MLHRELFARPYQMKLYEAAWLSMLPWWWAVNQSLGLLVRTTDEIREERETACWERYLLLLLLVPTLIVLLVTMWPFALGGFIVRSVLGKHRRPYRYSHCPNADHANIHRRIWVDLNRKRFFHVGTINSCLQPEFMARLNNLRNTQMRALELGRRVATSQLRPSPKIFVHSPSDSELKTNGTMSSPQHMALFSISEGGRLALAQSNDDTPCITYSNVKPEETSFYAASQQCKKVIPDGVAQHQQSDSTSSSNQNGSTPNSNNNDNHMQMSYTFACCSSKTGDPQGPGSQSSEQYGGQSSDQYGGQSSDQYGGQSSDQYGGQSSDSYPVQGGQSSVAYGKVLQELQILQELRTTGQGQSSDHNSGHGECTDGIHCNSDEDEEEYKFSGENDDDDDKDSTTSVPDIVPNKVKTSSDTASSPESAMNKSPVTTPDTDQIRSPSSPEECIETRIQIEIQQMPQTQAGGSSGGNNHNKPSTSASTSDHLPTEASHQSPPPPPPNSSRPIGRKNTATSTTPSSQSNSPSSRAHHSTDENIRDIPSPRDHGTCINFPPDLDFACFQEVFDNRAAKKLVNGLHGWFGHVVYDVGIDSWRTNRFVMNSGLVIASRYPIVDVAFECFKQSQNEDTIVSKGLLMVKVHIGQTREGNPIVGFIASTQLQVAQENNIRSLQMDSILTWMTGFHRNSDRIEPGVMELVAFDVLCGNFNFDNMSPGDMPDWSHPIFLIYHDPCRMRPGCDRPWTKGSLIQRERLHDEEVSSPEALQRTIEDPELRGCFLEDVEVYEPLDENMPWNTPDFHRYRGNGRRRVDYVMFSNHRTHLQQVCEEYAFVTQLATLTDHMPICMTLSATVGPAAAKDWPQIDTPDSEDSMSCKVMYETTV